jgi:LuxR family maltose regulon positive regulatory protein
MPPSPVSAKPTTKEAELLSLLEMGLSNQEIAERTEVSITTVKWHLRNLYRKLGVSNRNAALARARGLTQPNG